MIDGNCDVFLIEVNANPCLETQSCLTLQRIITEVVDGALQIAVDPIFQPPDLKAMWANTKKHLVPDNILITNRFELIFESSMANVII